MFSNKLRYLRNKKGLTQKQVSLILGISDARYNQYETGKRTPDDELKKQIANFYDVSVDYLIGNTYNPNIKNDYNNNSQELSLVIYNLLIEKGIITKDEVLTREKIDWLKKLIGHAIDLNKI